MLVHLFCKSTGFACVDEELQSVFLVSNCVKLVIYNCSEPLDVLVMISYLGRKMLSELVSITEYLHIFL